jgi:hypothetical protein
MKLILSSFFAVLLSAVAMAAPQILNWKSTEVSEKEALEATVAGVRIYAENENDCALENVWGFEAVNNLKDYYGNPLIVVNSIAEVSGSSCKLEKYLDCSTVFAKENGIWKYDDTTCDKEESAE